MPRLSRRLRFALATLAIGGVVAGILLLARYRARQRELPGERDTRAATLRAAAASTIPTVSAAAAMIALPGALFAYTTPANAAQLDRALPAPARVIHYVQINTALIAGKRSP